MTVAEVRSRLRDYDQETIIEIAAQLYRRVPKQRRDDDQIDAMILDYALSKEEKAVKKAIAVDFASLKSHIELFVEYVHSGYYSEPNRFISKAQRSKWRFVVRDLLKKLLEVKGEDAPAAAQFMATLYTILCEACHRYVFNTEAPFSAVGYQQRDLFMVVVSKLFYSGATPAAMKTAVELTIDPRVDRDTLTSYMRHDFVKYLKTPMLKEMAAEECVDFLARTKPKPPDPKKNRYDADESYLEKQRRNHAVELYFSLQCALYEYDKGIAFYKNNLTEKREEVKLYMLLDELNQLKLTDLWIREYEDAVRRNVNPYESLKQKYNDQVARAK